MFLVNIMANDGVWCLDIRLDVYAKYVFTASAVCSKVQLRLLRLTGLTSLLAKLGLSEDSWEAHGIPISRDSCKSENTGYLATFINIERNGASNCIEIYDRSATCLYHVCKSKEKGADPSSSYPIGVRYTWNINETTSPRQSLHQAELHEANHTVTSNAKAVLHTASELCLSKSLSSLHELQIHHYFVSAYSGRGSHVPRKVERLHLQIYRPTEDVHVSKRVKWRAFARGRTNPVIP